MKKMVLCGSLIILLVIGFVPLLPAQLVPQGKIGIMVNGGYSLPLTTLGERFKGTYNIDAGINYGVTERLGAEIRFVYGRYDKMSSNGRLIRYVLNLRPTTFAMNPAMEQYFRYAGITSSMTIGLVQSQSIKPYLILGTGIYRTDHFRGATSSYTQFYDPGNANYKAFSAEAEIYQAKHRTDYAWGANGGFGLAIPIGANASFDVKARWEVIMTELWAALYMGMEQVRPIQNFQLTGGINFNLR